MNTNKHHGIQHRCCYEFAAIALALVAFVLLCNTTAQARRPGDDDRSSPADHTKQTGDDQRHQPTMNRQPESRRAADVGPRFSTPSSSPPPPTTRSSSGTDRSRRFDERNFSLRQMATPPAAAVAPKTAPPRIVAGDASRFLADRGDSRSDSKSAGSTPDNTDRTRKVGPGTKSSSSVPDGTDRLRRRTLDTKSLPATTPPPPGTATKRIEADTFKSGVTPKTIEGKHLPSTGTNMEDVRKRLLEQERSGAASHFDRGLDHPLPSKFIPGGSAVIGNSPHVDAKNLANVRFHDRLNSGQLDRLTKGETAQKLKLDEQFKMLQQGDVARRLALEKHVGAGGPHDIHAANMMNVHTAVSPHVFDHGHAYYHGWVSPTYADHCFKYHYWGPSFFAGECWYPSWNPWVNWSWYYHCRPIWDPRPIWCRPVIYEPCPVWVYYDVPVWTPLPTVACGTWVDVPPVVAPPETYNLQLLAVRFVDPGHPEEKLGPRYRVWFRNDSARAVTQPFNVALFAGNGDQLAANLPQAGVRVISVEASDTQSVDVRLPPQVYAMGGQDQGNPIPYSTLHVLVDANREVPETNRADNGARLSRADILPVDPAAFEAQPQQAAPGGEIVLAGEGFGPQPGQVLVHMGGLELEGEIRGWYDLGARVALPKLPLAAPTEAELIVVRGDGAAANPLKIMVDPAQAAAQQ